MVVASFSALQRLDDILHAHAIVEGSLDRLEVFLRETSPKQLRHLKYNVHGAPTPTRYLIFSPSAYTPYAL